MIYWEQVNPRFFVGFHDDTLEFEVWQWEDPEGWMTGGDTVDELGDFQMSPAFSESTVNQEVCSRLEPSGYQHYLVLYGRSIYDESKWVVSLGASNEEKRFVGLNTRAPQWYHPTDSLSPLERLLTQVEKRYEEVRAAMHSRGPRHFKAVEASFIQTVPGFCSGCGLLNECHVPHKVPGFDNVKFSTAAQARPYMEAFKKHYQGALLRMSNMDLLEMPLPPNTRNLRVLAIEIRRRIEHNVPKSAHERLLGTDLVND